MKKILVAICLLLATSSGLFAQQTVSLGEPVVLFSAVAASTGNSTAYGIPGVTVLCTWQSSFSSSPASITLQFQTSNDNSNWNVSDSSTSITGAIQTVTTSARFLRARIDAVSGGSGITVTVVCKSGGSGGNAANITPFTAAVGAAASLAEMTITKSSLEVRSGPSLGALTNGVSGAHGEALLVVRDAQGNTAPFNVGILNSRYSTDIVDAGILYQDGSGNFIIQNGDPNVPTRQGAFLSIGPGNAAAKTMAIGSGGVRTTVTDWGTLAINTTALNGATAPLAIDYQPVNSTAGGAVIYAQNQVLANRTITEAIGVGSHVIIGTGTTVGEIQLFGGDLSLSGTSYNSSIYLLYLAANKLAGSAPGAIFGSWMNDFGPIGSANPYYTWYDSRGVGRCKEDSTFNSVGQVICVVYNPQFAKYTPGLANYERIIYGQWNSNVAEMGAEAGGSGTLRGLHLLGSFIDVGTTAGSPVLEIGASNGHIGFGANAGGYSNTVALYLDEIPTNTTAYFVHEAELSYNPTADNSSARHWLISDTETRSGNTKNFGGFYGTEYYFTHKGSGTMTGVTGNIVTVNKANGSGAFTSGVTGYEVDIANNSASALGDVSILTGTVAKNSTGTIGNIYGINIGMAGGTAMYGMVITGQTINVLDGYVEYSNMSTPSAPADNKGRFYMDTSGGKDRACIIFHTGAAQCFATEP